uniref:Extracellular protein 9-4 n=1 Tax=Passalora fulva TaxID=5499 RepID=A0A1P8YXX1_PASFU|nr:extracellular protein 9-4 [Fulvia fulva]
MKLLALAMSMALSLTAAQLTELYCDYGSGGNGDCERDGKYTYCCSYTPAVPFQVLRGVGAGTMDGDGNELCGPIRDGRQVGRLYCA